MRRFNTSRVIVAIVAVVLVGVLMSLALIGLASHIYQDELNYFPPQAGNEKSSANSNNPLQGVTKVNVIIDSTPLGKIGLSDENLRSEAVSRLRSAGITVAGNKDSDANGQIPILKISVFFSSCGPRCYSSVILFEFKEKVTPSRNPSLNIEATTWLKWVYDNYDDFPTERIPEELLKSLRGGLELFLGDMRSAN